MGDFSVSAVVFCDDARKEVNGKDILIGVYGGGILVSSLPAQIPIAVWLEIIPERAGTLELDLRVRLPGNPMGMQVRTSMEVQNVNDSISFYTPQALCLVGDTGDIEISIKAGNDTEWTVIKRKHVHLGPAQAAQIPQVNYGPPPPDDFNARPSGRPTASEPPSEQSPSAAPASKPSRAPRRPSTRRSGRTPAPE